MTDAIEEDIRDLKFYLEVFYKDCTELTYDYDYLDEMYEFRDFWNFLRILKLFFSQF